MNLHNQLPGSIYEISTGATTSVAPKNGKFFAVTCSIAGVVKVKGGGNFTYIDIDSASASDVVKYIDPNTGSAYADEAAAAGDAVGFYERISSEEVNLTMIAGQTIYGRFDSLRGDGTFTGFAYAG
jgi:hypothetical protein